MNDYKKNPAPPVPPVGPPNPDGKETTPKRR